MHGGRKTDQLGGVVVVTLNSGIPELCDRQKGTGCEKLGGMPLRERDRRGIDVRCRKRSFGWERDKGSANARDSDGLLLLVGEREEGVSLMCVRDTKSQRHG